MENRFESFSYLIMKCAKLIGKIKTIEIEEYKLKGIDVMCIYYLSKNENGLSNKELVSLTSEDKGAISRAMKDLKDKNIVSYEANKYNGLICLTPKGLEISKYIDLKSDEALDFAADALSDEERVAFYSYLSKIEDKLEKYYDNLKQNKNN